MIRSKSLVKCLERSSWASFLPYSKQAFPKAEVQMIHKLNQGGSQCNVQVNSAELAWTNALTTDVLRGGSPRSYRHSLLAYSCLVLIFLAHSSISSFTCVLIHAHIHKTNSIHPYSTLGTVPGFTNMEVSKQSFTHPFIPWILTWHLPCAWHQGHSGKEHRQGDCFHGLFCNLEEDTNKLVNKK